MRKKRKTVKTRKVKARKVKTRKAKKAKRKTNNKGRSERDTTQLARERVLDVARRDGVISNKQAKRIGKWSQAWYHLHAMVQAGQLKRSGYNQWMPVRSR